MWKEVHVINIDCGHIVQCLKTIFILLHIFEKIKIAYKIKFNKIMFENLVNFKHDFDLLPKNRTIGIHKVLPIQCTKLLKQKKKKIKIKIKHSCSDASSTQLNLDGKLVIKHPTLSTFSINIVNKSSKRLKGISHKLSGRLVKTCGDFSDCLVRKTSR